MTTGRRPALRPATRTCECPTCGERFASFTGFEGHRKPNLGVAGVRACKKRRELLKEGWTQDRQGRWMLPRRRDGKL